MVVGMTDQLNVDELRDEIRDKYAAVVLTPTAEFHFHTGRQLTDRLGYDQRPVDELPEIAVESFAGVANPFEQRRIQPGEKIVDLGSGAGLDSFLAAKSAGPDGRVGMWPCARAVYRNDVGSSTPNFAQSRGTSW